MTVTAHDVAARARALVELGRITEAITMLQQALAEHPQDTQLLALLSQAQLDVDPEAAETTAQKLIEADPEGHRGYLLASLAASRRGKRKEGIRHAEAAVQKAPHEHACYAQHAQALAGKEGRAYRRGRASARRALELAPHSPLGHIAAGNVELGVGHRWSARRHYRRALELDPQQRVAQTNIAIASHGSGDRAGALGILQNLLVLDPNDPQARRLFDRAIHTVIIDFQFVVLAATLLLFLLRNP